MAVEQTGFVSVTVMLHKLPQGCSIYLRSTNPCLVCLRILYLTRAMRVRINTRFRNSETACLEEFMQAQ